MVDKTTGSILVINPNTTVSMTEKIAAAARTVAAPGTAITATNPDAGLASIEGAYDCALAAAGILRLMEDNRDFGGYIIACFDDTGLDAARCITTAPVVGIGEAGYHMASLVAAKFGVITTLPRSVNTLEGNLMRSGLSACCSGVRAADIPVLALESGDGDALGRIKDEVAAAIAHDGAEAIVLGCAGMADLAGNLQSEYGVPVIDGVAAAVKLIEGLMGMGVGTSGIRSYAPPRKK